MGNDMSMIEPYYDSKKGDYNIGYPKYGDVIRWRGNLKVYEDSKHKKGKDAHVIVTKHRIYFFAPKQQKVPEYHAHLFDIKKIEIKDANTTCLTFKQKKKDKTIDFIEPSAVEMCKAIRSSIRDTTNNYQEDKICKIIDPKKVTLPSDSFDLSPPSAMVEAYLSISSYKHELPSINHIYFLQKLNTTNNYQVDFSLIPGVCNDKTPLAFTLSTAFTGLSYNNTFSQICLRDINVPGLDKAIAMFLKNNQVIQVLEIVHCPVKIDISQFAEELQNSPVQVINFSQTQIVKADVLGKVFQNRVYKIAQLNLNDCGISKMGEMIRGLLLNENLTKSLIGFNIGNNDINSDSIEQLIVMIDKIRELQGDLKFLNVANLGLPLDRFITPIKGLKQLEYFNLTGNKFAKLDKAMDLIGYFQNNKTLKQVCMTKMSFQIDHIVPVLSSLATNETLTELALDLKDNGFGQDGGVELYKILPSFKNVRKLDISNNKLKGKAISRILTFMGNFNKIESLCIGDNPMNGKDLEEFINNLIEFVKSHKTLKILAINGIADKNEPYINDFITSIETNDTLLGLDISDNCLDDTTTIPLAELIMHNHSLIALNFDSNNFTTEGFLSLSYAIEFNATISFVDYPTVMFKQILKQKMSEALQRRFQESFYNFFNKVKTNKYNNYFNDVRIFDTINTYPIELGKSEKALPSAEVKVVARDIVRQDEEEYEMPEQFRVMQELKRSPKYYYDY